MGMKCATCEAPLGAVCYVFALQGHHVEYSRCGDTPSDQAVLRPSVMTTLGRYCSSACFKQELPEQLECLGLPTHLQHNRVLGGPICPCGKCGKPVNMTQPHAAVIKGKVLLLANGEEDAPTWLDILTVLCKDCMGLTEQEMMALARPDTDQIESDASLSEQRAIRA